MIDPFTWVIRGTASCSLDWPLASGIGPRSLPLASSQVRVSTSLNYGHVRTPPVGHIGCLLSTIFPVTAAVMILWRGLRSRRRAFLIVTVRVRGVAQHGAARAGSWTPRMRSVEEETSLLRGRYGSESSMLDIICGDGRSRNTTTWK